MMMVKVPIDVMAASYTYREYLNPNVIAVALTHYPRDVYPFTIENLPIALKGVHLLTMGDFDKTYPMYKQFYPKWGKYIFHYNGAIQKLVQLTKGWFIHV